MTRPAAAGQHLRGRPRPGTRTEQGEPAAALAGGGAQQPVAVGASGYFVWPLGGGSPWRVGWSECWMMPAAPAVVTELWPGYRPRQS